MAILSFQLSNRLYIKDPQATELGRNMVQQSISLIDTLGFDDFTFKKLGIAIGSTEASVYRYFENKHKLLIYLMDWYWTWLEYRIDYAINNIADPKERLSICLLKLSEKKVFDPTVAYIDESALERIVIAEFEKTYLTKQVDSDNRDGLFLPYKSLCKKIACLIKGVSPDYQNPHSLASTILLVVKHQLYYAKHLPTLSDIKHDTTTEHKGLMQFLENLVFNTIKY